MPHLKTIVTFYFSLLLLFSYLNDQPLTKNYLIMSFGDCLLSLLQRFNSLNNGFITTKAKSLKILTAKTVEYLLNYFLRSCYPTLIGYPLTYN